MLVGSRRRDDDDVIAPKVNPLGRGGVGIVVFFDPGKGRDGTRAKKEGRHALSHTPRSVLGDAKARDVVQSWRTRGCDASQGTVLWR